MLLFDRSAASLSRNAVCARGRSNFGMNFLQPLPGAAPG